MSLQKLPSIQTKTEPAQTEKNYDSWFMRDLHVQANSETAKTRIIVTRYDYNKKELSTEHIKFTKDAYIESNKWQCWQDAIGALLSCVALAAQEEEILRILSPMQDEKKELETEKQTILEEDPDADTSTIDSQIEDLEAEISPLQTQLDGIYAEMGSLT